MAYLNDHPPKRSQFRCPRRQPVSGLIVVHTAESVMDSVGVDTGAENVARFIQGRDTPGSYHELVDSDSVISMVKWDCEAYHDGTGSNPHSFGLSFACRTEDWAKMSKERRTAFITRGAKRAADYALWVKATRGIIIPAERVTRPESEQKRPGFISHGQRDPGRRTDPGQDFPWTEFLALFKRFSIGSGAGSASKPEPQPPTPEPEDEMSLPWILQSEGKPTRLMDPPVAIVADKLTLDSAKYSGARTVVATPTDYDEIISQITRALD